MLEADEMGDCRRCGMRLDLDHRGERMLHRCCICGDGGRVRLGFPLGDPYFGKAVLCGCREAMAARGAA
jgi:hypothetical protein